MTDNGPTGGVRFELDGGVAVLRLDRPKVNAIDSAMQRRLTDLARDCTERDDVAAVVLTGGDRVFAAGADIAEMREWSSADVVGRSTVLQQCFSALARIPKPVVAAVNGYALGGGCELALCADRRIVASDATLGQPEIKLGIIPGAGGTQRLTRLVGPSVAKDLVLSGRFVQAAEALRIGLADEVVAPDQVLPAALAWARQFVGGPALALRAAKECIDRGADLDLDAGLELERSQFAALFATEDRREGMESFLSRGPGRAVFRGR